jgi:hypothetical protein
MTVRARFRHFEMLEVLRDEGGALIPMFASYVQS